MCKCVEWCGMKEKILLFDLKGKNLFHLISPFDYRTLIEIKYTWLNLFAVFSHSSLSFFFVVFICSSPGAMNIYWIHTHTLLNRLFCSSETPMQTLNVKSAIAHVSASIQFHAINTHTCHIFLSLSVPFAICASNLNISFFYFSAFFVRCWSHQVNVYVYWNVKMWKPHWKCTRRQRRSSKIGMSATSCEQIQINRKSYDICFSSYLRCFSRSLARSRSHSLSRWANIVKVCVVDSSAL